MELFTIACLERKVRFFLRVCPLVDLTSFLGRPHMQTYLGNKILHDEFSKTKEVNTNYGGYKRIVSWRIWGGCRYDENILHELLKELIKVRKKNMPLVFSISGQLQVLVTSIQCLLFFLVTDDFDPRCCLF